MTDATVYAIASGKGGVGKTTTAVNLGAGFARAGRSVVVVDLDLGMANLGDFVEATPAGPTLHEVLAGDATLDDALSHASPGLDVILGSEDLELFGRADPRGIRKVLTDLKDRYDVVILDSGGGLSHDTALPLGLADSVILVSTVEKPAVKNTKKTLDLADLLEGQMAGIILTRVGGGKEEVDPADIASRLGLTLLGSVPEDSAVKASANAGEPLLSYDADSPAAQAYLEIAYDLLGETLPVGFGDRADAADTPAAPTPAAEPAETAESGESDPDEGADSADAGDSGAEGDLVSEGEPESGEVAIEADPATTDDTPDTGDEAEAEEATTEETTGADIDAEDGVAFEPEPDQEVEPPTETADDSPAEGGLVEDQSEDDEEEPEKRSFLSKITGGLLG